MKNKEIFFSNSIVVGDISTDFISEQNLSWAAISRQFSVVKDKGGILWYLFKTPKIYATRISGNQKMKPDIAWFLSDG